ncbi:hypothetical protein Aduo_019820 [Ancylostoma duodenale]
MDWLKISRPNSKVLVNYSSYGKHECAEMSCKKITDGIWQQPVNLSSCFSDSRRQATIISVEIRDRGTGNRGESMVTFDPLAAGFEVVPLRPVFNARTKNILVMVSTSVENYLTPEDPHKF